MAGLGDEWDPLMGPCSDTGTPGSPTRILGGNPFAGEETPRTPHGGGRRSSNTSEAAPFMGLGSRTVSREFSRGHSSSQGSEGKDEAAARPIYLDEIVEEDMTEVKDFSTIDWALFNEHDRERSSKVMALYRNEPPLLRALHVAYEASQGWIALTIIGFVSGLLAAVVGIGSDWASDMKYGYCAGRGWWLTRSVCCASAGPEGCTAWLAWHTALNPDADSSTLLLLSYGSYVAAAVLMATMSSYMVVSLAPYAAGSGISELKVILGGFVIKRFLGVLTLLVKSVGLVLSVGAGMNLGKEGPFVHTSACCANVVCRFFPKYRSNEAKKRELFSCSAAAGVAVAFGAPIGGVLFSFEEVSSYFPAKTMWRSFYCAMIAAISLSSLQSFSSKLVMFEITYHHKWHLFELPFFALLGVAGGMIGALIIKVNASVCAFRRTSRLKHWPVTEVAVVCMVTAAVHFPIIFLRGAATSLLQALFSDCDKEDPEIGSYMCADSHQWDIVGLLIGSAGIKMALLVFTFGTKVPGGIFIPCLCTGALIGRGMGIALQQVHSVTGDFLLFEECAAVSTCIRPPIYAIVGGAAVLGGVTRMTVSLVVIMIEVTGGMSYVIPIMLGVMVAKLVGDAFSSNTIYLEAIRSQGYPLLEHGTRLTGDAMEETVSSMLEHTGQGDVVTSAGEHPQGVASARGGLYAIRSFGETVGSIDRFLRSNGYHGFPVVCDDLAPVGYIRRSTIVQVLDEALVDLRVNGETPVVFSAESAARYSPSVLVVNLGRWMDKGAMIVLSKTPFPSIISVLLETGMRYLLVAKDGALTGIIKKKDVLEYIEHHERLARQAAEEEEAAAAGR